MKTGGRKEGTPNVLTKNIRETIQQFIETNIDSFQDTYDQMEPYQKAQTLTRLLDFVTPKMKQVEGNFDIEGKNTFTPITGITFDSDNELLPDLSALNYDELIKIESFTRRLNNNGYDTFSKSELIEYSELRDKVKFSKNGSSINVINPNGADISQPNLLSLKD